jgi:O-antigen biosynthesis protein
MNENVFEHLHRYAIARELCRDKVVLDIASGEGYGAALLSEAARQVTGVDISEVAIAAARKKYRRRNLDFKVGSATAIPLAESLLDLVVSFETLEHLEDHERMLSEVKRVLKPEGRIVISTPDKKHYSDIPDYDNPFHMKELYLEEFRQLLEAHFKHVQILLQRVVFGSVVSPQVSSGLVEYTGDFSNVRRHEGLCFGVYSIGIGSDRPLEEMPTSLFDGLQPLLAARDEQWRATVQGYETSLSYRLGRTLTWPVRCIRGLVSPSK